MEAVLEKEIITLAHGSGGKLSHQLIQKVFYPLFDNAILQRGDDGAKITMQKSELVVSTDSFVISPVFFNGGNIGKLSVCGTVNDILAMGAIPKYLTCGFILEEGLLMDELLEVVKSMAETARKANVQIIAGDTKVVGRGACDKIFINTTGIGEIRDGANVSGANAKEGDVVIITGTMGDHGASVLLSRENLGFTSSIKSDCAALNTVIDSIFEVTNDVHVLRDPTRGGVSTTLNEIAQASNVEIFLEEDCLPVDREVAGVCELTGLDPLNLANEGKMLVILPEYHAEEVLKRIQNDLYGKNAKIIGKVTGEHKKKVTIRSITGGVRFVDVPVGDPLPRIC